MFSEFKLKIKKKSVDFYKICNIYLYLSVFHCFMFKIIIKTFIMQKQCIKINNMTNYYRKITFVMVNPNSLLLTP
jgi:hypothetical protein